MTCRGWGPAGPTQPRRRARRSDVFVGDGGRRTPGARVGSAHTRARSARGAARHVFAYAPRMHCSEIDAHGGACGPRPAVGCPLPSPCTLTRSPPPSARGRRAQASARARPSSPRAPCHDTTPTTGRRSRSSSATLDGGRLVTAPAAPRAVAELRSGLFAFVYFLFKFGSSSASSGGSSDGMPSARTRATRPRRLHTGPLLPSPLALPATHPFPPGAGRCGRRRRAAPHEQEPPPASCRRHRRARRRGRAADASRPHAAERGPGRAVASVRAARRAHTCVCYRACMSCTSSHEVQEAFL